MLIYHRKPLKCVHLSPELDVEERCIKEVSQTLDVDDLLHLSTSFYERLHCFSLNVELWDQSRYCNESTNQHPQIIDMTKKSSLYHNVYKEE